MDIKSAMCQLRFISSKRSRSMSSFCLINVGLGLFVVFLRGCFLCINESVLFGEFCVPPLLPSLISTSNMLAKKLCATLIKSIVSSLPKDVCPTLPCITSPLLLLLLLLLMAFVVTVDFLIGDADDLRFAEGSSSSESRKL
uniref:Uncharacterized protein n=1 Tax=Glossina brevipalpis TaxID=37001 RepID=A0A1A9W0Z7_9MUSC